MYLALANGFLSLLWFQLFLGTCRDLWGYFWMSPYSIYVLWEYDGIPHKYFVYLQIGSIILEIMHWAMGVVPANIYSLLIHSSGRLVIALIISYCLPYSIANFSVVYAMLLLVWSWADTLKYSYYFTKESKMTPRWLEICRHSHFIILYPMALFFSTYLVYLALHDAYGIYSGILLASMSLYGCGYAWMFMHMWERRQRVYQLKHISRDKLLGEKCGFNNV